MIKPEETKIYEVHLAVKFQSTEKDKPIQAIDVVRRVNLGGFNATIVDIVEAEPDPVTHEIQFRLDAMEGGHGDAFWAYLTVVRYSDGIVVESVDIAIEKSSSLDVPMRIPIGAVGGELDISGHFSSDLAITTISGASTIAKVWIGQWHREFMDDADDSVKAMFLMAKEIILLGEFSSTEVRK
jgi:hypothetical protein